MSAAFVALFRISGAVECAAMPEVGFRAGAEMRAMHGPASCPTALVRELHCRAAACRQPCSERGLQGGGDAGGSAACLAQRAAEGKWPFTAPCHGMVTTQ